jgi:hypothetical protein
MGTQNKEKVQLVISHLEGCSGNFLGRLYAGAHNQNASLFRTDVNLHPKVLAIDGYANWATEVDKLENHTVVVTHNFDQSLIRSTFPNACTIALYPYTHTGNVLYNICFKKSTNKIPNVIDNHLIHLKEWYAHILQRRPAYQCVDFWSLSDLTAVEALLETKLTDTQTEFFNCYWQHQLTLNLEIPTEPRSIQQLIQDWKIQDQFDDWFAAWTIFVYELINNKFESQRTWSIDVEVFCNWNDVGQIQGKYNDTPNYSN